MTTTVATTVVASTKGASTTIEPDLQDCPVDPNGDLEDPNNLFTCLATESCCTVDLNPACCAKKDMKDEIIDQLELWGPLLLVIILLALLIWWCRSDETCCDVEKPWLYRCGCKKRNPEDDVEDQSQMEDVTGSKVSLKSTTTAMIMVDDETVDAVQDKAELEEAADNLEKQLEEEEANELNDNDDNNGGSESDHADEEEEKSDGQEDKDKQESDKEGNDDETESQDSESE